MTLKVLTFGIVKDICGGLAVDIQLEEGTTIEMLRSSLIQQYPELHKLTSFVIAVNSEYALPGTTIFPGDEVAIIPPVSGG